MTTQTKWHIGVRKPESNIFIYGENGEEVANCDMATNSHDDNLANTRLIVCAPDLLVSLKWMVSMCKAESEHVGIYKAHIEQAESIINKAEGNA